MGADKDRDDDRKQHDDPEMSLDELESIEEAWRIEVDRRVAEVDAGTAEMVDVPQDFIRFDDEV